MWIYLALFLWPALSAIVEKRPETPLSYLSMGLLGLLMTLIIGLRFEIGVDWYTYLIHLDRAAGQSFIESIQHADPAYALLNWIAAVSGSGIWLVNLICAAIFVSGLFVFCRKLPHPWLALSVGMPYIAIVMAMNYTRQGVAFGLVLLALAALMDGRIRRFAIYVVIASLFHKSAVLLLPVGALASTRNRFWVFFWIAIVTVLAFLAFVGEYVDRLVNQYIEGQMASAGGGVRVAMNAVWSKPHDGHYWGGFSESILPAPVMGGHHTSAKDWIYYMVGGAPGVISVPSGSEYKSLAQLVSAAKANPGKIKASASASGGIWHTKLIALEKGAGIKFNFIPFADSHFS